MRTRHRVVLGGWLAQASLLAVAIALAATAAGCVEDPISPSQVTRLRILGLKPDPAQPLPGEQVSLELLWADPAVACDAATTCPAGQECRDGLCVRPDPSVQVLWFVVRLSGWESIDASMEGGGLSGLLSSQLEIPGFGQCSLDQASCSLTCDGGVELSLWELCSLACMSGETGDLALCCGDASASRFELTVPADVEVPADTCDQDVAIDTSQVLQVQAQVCAGGRIDLCNPDLESLSFPCVGEGAESVTAISRVRLGADRAEVNLGPTIETPLWGRLESAEIEPWGSEAPIEVAGCRDDDCAERACSTQAECTEFDETSTARQGATSCVDGRCREEFSLALSPEAQETYLRPCDQDTACDLDADCPSSLVCDCGDDGVCAAGEGRCRRLESPVVAFFGDGGSFLPGRSVLDTDGDGLPERSRFRTRWLPPVLEACASDLDCTPGTCDPAAGRCVREVSIWIVARDGRGGQDWIERTVRVVP